MFWALWILGALAVAVLIYRRDNNDKYIALSNKLPGPKTVPVLGNATQIGVKDEAFLNILQKWIEEHGDLFRVWFGPDLNVVVTNPDYVKALLSSPKTTFKGKNYKFMADVLGPGILTGSGPTWRRDRKLASPNYGRRAVEAYTDVFNSETDLLVGTLRTKANVQFDIYKEIVKYTSYSVCQTLLGLTREETMKLPHLQYLIDETHNIYDVTFERMTIWFMQIASVFWLSGKLAYRNNYIRLMLEFSDSVIAYRRKKLEEQKEQVESLIKKSVNEDSTENTHLSVIDRFILSKQLDTYELQTETFTVFTSSQEASVKISCFLLMMMAYHPKCQEKLVSEIQSVVGLEPGAVTDDDLRNMPYLDMVFKEVVRLFPVGTTIHRQVLEDIELTKDITIPAGSGLVIPIYHILRDPRYWLHPNDFDPERFTPENTKLRNPFSFIPFSVGAMDCLGRHFGAKLVKTLCIKVLREFHVSSQHSYKDLKLKVLVSVTSANRFHLTLTPRKPKNNLVIT